MRGKLFEDLVVSAGGGRTVTRTLALPASGALHLAAALGVALVALRLPDQLSTPKSPSPLPVFVPTEVRVSVKPAGDRLPRARPSRTTPVRASAPELPVLQLSPTVSDLPPSDDVTDVTAPAAAYGTGAGGDPDGDPRATGKDPGPGDGGPGSGDPPVVRGGDIDPPRLLRSVTPVYPEMARLARLQGVVELQCVIDTDGRVIDVKVLRGQPILTGAAVQAVEEWLYSPTRLNGIPVRVILTVKVKFTLQ
jgi:protein TonB